MNTLKVGEKEIFWFDFAFFYLSVIKHTNIESTDTIRPGNKGRCRRTVLHA